MRHGNMILPGQTLYILEGRAGRLRCISRE